MSCWRNSHDSFKTILCNCFPCFEADYNFLPPVPFLGAFVLRLHNKRELTLFHLLLHGGSDTCLACRMKPVWSLVTEITSGSSSSVVLPISSRVTRSPSVFLLSWGFFCFSHHVLLDTCTISLSLLSGLAMYFPSEVNQIAFRFCAAPWSALCTCLSWL